MAKKSITPLELAEKYLIKIGIDKFLVKRSLMPSLFDDNIMCKKMTTHNLVTKNKEGNQFTQTHLYINKSFGEICFTPAQTASYIANPVQSNNQNSKQQIHVFESNIQDMLVRRTKNLSSTVVAYPPKKTYVAGTNNLLITNTTKLYNTQGSSIQIHMGIQDDDIFKDFRLGLLLDDYLIMLKYVSSDDILAISIPKEFCSKYNITGLSRINRKATASATDEKKQYDKDDSAYSSESNSKSIKSERTPLAPAPAPAGSKRSASDKVKYHGKASRGKAALEDAKYLCEYDSTHTSFISENTGLNYMEPHHLIPISKQGLFDNDIDISPNLVSLCPICHKQIHHGQNADVKRMLAYFLRLRDSNLKKCGIDVDISTLCALYDLH